MASEKRLIDAKPFMKAGWHLVRTGKSNEYLASLSLADVPTVDAVEVVHGRWIERYEKVSWHEDDIERFFECSICECLSGYSSPYCPNCGAKMD